MVSLMLAGQLGVSAHLALVPHTVCAVHGELIHAAVAVDELHAAPRASAAPATQPQVSAHPARSNHDDDEHCGVLANRREQAALSGRPEPLTHARSPAATGAWTPAVTSPLEATFRIAPKQSPPA